MEILDIGMDLLVRFGYLSPKGIVTVKTLFKYFVLIFTTLPRRTQIHSVLTRNIP